MVGSLTCSQAFLEDIVDPFLFGPLEVPPLCVDLSPLPVLEGLEDAVSKGRPESDLGTAWQEHYW